MGGQIVGQLADLCLRSLRRSVNVTPMPKVSVSHKTNSAPDEAFSKIKSFFETDSDLRKIDPNIKITFADASKTGKATASQFTASFDVKPSDAGSTVNVTIDLPLLLTPFKGKVQETLEKKLKKYLA